MLQDKKSIHKNHLHFYMVTMKNQKEKLRLTQRNFVLAQKQKYRAMEQDRKPINKPIYLWVPYFQQRKQEYTIGQRQPLQ